MTVSVCPCVYMSLCLPLCLFEHVFVATKHVFCRDNEYTCRDKTFVATNLILSRQAYFCRDKRRVTNTCDKHVIIAGKHVFLATKMILVAAPANDTQPFATKFSTVLRPYEPGSRAN